MTIAFFALFFASLAAAQSSRSGAATATGQLERYVAYCAEDGSEAEILNFLSGTTIARVGDVELQIASVGAEGGATFRFVRQGKSIFNFSADDLLAPDVWIAIDFRNSWLAITYSDGGELGGFHVRVFQISKTGVSDTSSKIAPAVAAFKSKHSCESRGNNVQALKWIKNDLLLMTSVYPTSDCGADMGHTEAYLVVMPNGNILQHLTLQELKHYPGVCLKNDGD